MPKNQTHEIHFARPGGLALTDRAHALCRLAPRDRVLDVGCGDGCSVRHLIANHGLRAVGIDLRIAPHADAPTLIVGDAHALPFADDAFDAVFFECSLSKMENPERALGEARRVLRPGGALAVSDFFTHGVPRKLDGVLGRLETHAAWAERLQTAGFEIQHTEDRTGDLRALWGQLVFDYGSERLFAALSGNAGDAEAEAKMFRKKAIGYFLTIARACKGRQPA